MVFLLYIKISLNREGCLPGVGGKAFTYWFSFCWSWKQKHIFHVARHCIRAHSGLQGVSVHCGSEDNRTSCEVTALAKHHKRKFWKTHFSVPFFYTDFWLETQTYWIWNGFLLWSGFFLSPKPFKVPLPSLKPCWSLMWENVGFFPTAFSHCLTNSEYALMCPLLLILLANTKHLICSLLLTHITCITIEKYCSIFAGRLHGKAM